MTVTTKATCSTAGLQAEQRPPYRDAGHWSAKPKTRASASLPTSSELVLYTKQGTAAIAAVTSQCQQMTNTVDDESKVLTNLADVAHVPYHIALGLPAICDAAFDTRLSLHAAALHKLATWHFHPRSHFRCQWLQGCILRLVNPSPAFVLYLLSFVVLGGNSVQCRTIVTMSVAVGSCAHPC